MTKKLIGLFALLAAALFLLCCCGTQEEDSSSGTSLSDSESDISEPSSSSSEEISDSAQSSEDESSASVGSSSGGTASLSSSASNHSSASSAASSGNDGTSFSWDPGGNYTGGINVAVNVLSGQQAAGGGAIIDYGNASLGYVMVQKGTDVKTKIRVQGPNGGVYQRYILPAAGQFYGIPLQMGSGTYTVSVYQQVGDKYAQICTTTFDVSITSGYTLYPNIYANYGNSSAAVRKGFGLCMNAGSDLDKVKSVYNWIVSNISYDYAKASSVSAAYVPNPDATLSSRTGICFDYACLMATMLRSQGIPTRIVFGYAGGAFHAWNDVYIRNTGWISVGIPSNGGWKRLDSTFGTVKAASYLENSANYTATEYF